MKIEKGTMIFEIITNNWYETKNDIDDGDLIANVINQAGKSESILMSNVTNPRYYTIHHDKKFLISQNNTNMFLTEYRKACEVLKAKFDAVKDDKDATKKLWRNTFLEPAKIIVGCMNDLDASLGKTGELLAKWQL